MPSRDQHCFLWKTQMVLKPLSDHAARLKVSSRGWATGWRLLRFILERTGLPSELRVMQERQARSCVSGPVHRTDFFKVTLSVIVCISSSELSEKNELPIHPRINLKLQDLEEGAVLLPGESRQTPFPRSRLVLKSLDLLGRVGLGQPCSHFRVPACVPLPQVDAPGPWPKSQEESRFTGVLFGLRGRNATCLEDVILFSFCGGEPVFKGSSRPLSSPTSGNSTVHNLLRDIFLAPGEGFVDRLL